MVGVILALNCKSRLSFLIEGIKLFMKDEHVLWDLKEGLEMVVFALDGRCRSVCDASLRYEL